MRRSSIGLRHCPSDCVVVPRVPAIFRSHRRRLALLFRDECLELWREGERRSRPDAGTVTRRRDRKVVGEELRARRLAALAAEQIAREVVRHVRFGEDRVVRVRAVRSGAQVHSLRLIE